MRLIGVRQCRTCHLAAPTHVIKLSPPRDNVRFVPSRNVRLTRSRWGSGRTRSSDYDPAGARPSGSAEESRQEVDHAPTSGNGNGRQRTASTTDVEEAEEGGRQGGTAWITRARLEAEVQPGDARSSDAGAGARSVPGVRSDAGQRIPGQETWHRDGTGSGTAIDAGRGIVARRAAAGGAGARVARAAQQPRGAGAVGHLDTRMAGGARGKDVPDPHDRRCHERVDGALCALGFHRGEYASAGGIPGTQRSAGSVLYRQSKSVSDRTQDAARSEGASARRAGCRAAHADGPGFGGIGDLMDWSAFAGRQRTRGKKFLHGPGPAGEGAPGRGSQDAGRGQPVSGTGVSAVVEPAFNGRAGQSHRRAPAAGTGTQSGSFSQPCGNAERRLRLYNSTRHQNLSRCSPAARAAGRQCASGSAAGRVAGGAVSRSVSQDSGVPAATERTALIAARRSRSPAQTATAQCGLATGSGWGRTARGAAPVEGYRNQSYSAARSDGLSSGKRNKERRAKAVRRTFAFTKPKASAPKLHRPDVAKSKSKSKPPELRHSRVLELPISNGASPIASALGIRLGATPDRKS